jgi:hypothetical protein
MVSHNDANCKKTVAKKNNIETTIQATYITKKYLHTCKNERVFLSVRSIDLKYLLTEFPMDSKKLAICDIKDIFIMISPR